MGVGKLLFRCQKTIIWWKLDAENPFLGVRKFWWNFLRVSMKLPEKHGGGEVITLAQRVSFKTLALFQQIIHPSVHWNQSIFKIWPKSDTTCQVANFGTAFSKSGTSREPVGNQSGTSREPVGNQSGTSRENPSTSREGPKMDQKSTKKGPKTGFLKRCADFPDWFRTGSRFEKNGANLRRFWCQLFNDFWRQKSNCFGLKTGWNPRLWTYQAKQQSFQKVQASLTQIVWHQT